jgi:hypothetical protein
MSGPMPHAPSPGRRQHAVQAFLISAALLALVVGAGVVAIVTIRSRWRAPAADHVDWESALAGYKKLRDKGVLSDEEYRKIKTLVGPLTDRADTQTKVTELLKTAARERE